MDVVTTVVLLVLAFFLLFCLFMLHRNSQVCAFRIQMNKEESAYLQDRVNAGKGYDGFRRYDSLPAYDAMFYRFWLPLRHWERPLRSYYEDCEEATNESPH